MALELFAGAGLGVLFGELQKEICRVKKNFEIFKPKLEELEGTVALLYPVIQEIEELNKRLNRPNHGGETIKLRTLLEDGIELVSKCSKIPRWKRGRYGGKLVELENKILKFHNVCLLGPMARDQKQNLLLSQVTTKMMFMYLNQQGFSNITMGFTDPSDLTTPSSTGSSNITASLSAFGESNTSGSSLQVNVFLKVRYIAWKNYPCHLPELTEMHQTIAAKLQLHELLPHQAMSMSNQLATIVKAISEGEILPGLKERLPMLVKYTEID